MIGLMILTLTIDLSIWVTLHPCHAIMVGLLGYHSLSMACTVHIGRLWMWCCGHGQSSTFRSLRWLVLPDVYASKMTGVLRANNQLCRQRHLWGYRSRTRTLTLTLKLTLTLTLFLTLTRTFFLKENKNDIGI